MDIQKKLEETQDRAYQLQDLLKESKQKTRDTSFKELAHSIEKLPKTSIRQRKIFKGHSSKILDTSWSPYGEEEFLSISQDGLLLIWNSQSMLKEHVIMLKSNWMMCCDYGKESMVACGGLDNVGSIYSLVEVDTETASASRLKGIPNHRPRVELVGHDGYLSAIELIESSQKAITSSGDGRSKLWDVNSGGRCINTFKGHYNDVCCITCLPGTQLFISSGCDGISRLWDTRIKGEEHNCSRIFLGHTQEITCNDSFPDGNAFVSGSEDGSCRIYDLRADRTMQVLNDDKKNGKISPITSCSFTISGRGIIFGQEKNNIQQASTSTASNVLKEKDMDSNIMFGNLNIWDALCGEKIGILLGAHNGKITSIKTSPMGNCMISSSWDGIIKLWA